MSGKGDPHPWRCETCNRPIGKPGGTDDCPISVPSHLDVAVTYCYERTGCASHSNAAKAEQITTCDVSIVQGACPVCPQYQVCTNPRKRKVVTSAEQRIAAAIKEPSSEPAWITIHDGSDRDWRLISMHELHVIEHAINEECVGKTSSCPPGHLGEMHDAGNAVVDRVRDRQKVSAISLLKGDGK